MANEERAMQVRNWCKENGTPIQELCPTFIQYFKNKNGYEFWYSDNGERQPIEWDPTGWRAVRNHGMTRDNVVCVRSEYEGFYLRFIKELDALEIARVLMDGGRGKDGETREWRYAYRYHDRYVIFHDDPTAYSADGYAYRDVKYYSKILLVAMRDWSRKSFVCKANLDEFHKFDDKYFTADHIPYMYQYAQWYMRDFMQRNKSDLYQTLSDYDLDDASLVLKHRSAERVIKFQALDDKYAVLRVYKFPSDFEIKHYNGDPSIGNEIARLFISSKGKPTLMVFENGSWKIKSSTPWEASGNAMLLNTTEMETWKPIKYIMPCLDEVNIQNFINILRHPIVEQVAKAGYPNIAKGLQLYGEIPNNLRAFCMVEKEKKLPMFKLLGVNKYVLSAAEKYENPKIIREIKFFAGGFDATEVSEEVCEHIAKYIGNAGGYRFGGRNSLIDLLPNHPIGWVNRKRDAYATPLTDEEKKWIIKLFRMEEKNEGCIQMYRDVISTYRCIHNRPDIDLFSVKSRDDLSRLHDALVNLQIREQQERRAFRDASEKERQEMLQKAFEKRQDDRIAKFEYEDDNFCIRVPHELSEITREGIVLHHCVGGYVNRHAQGSTNIIFLRKKSDEYTPFYTIEIDNNDRVIQIHGSHNRWLGNNPEAVPFVYKYLNQLGAKFEKKLLLNKGAGYSAGSESLDESYLVA